jgi:predicted flap endonuclease-1-like 5' DNA nuclease
MPDITAVHFAIFALLFTAGAALGWIMRGDRCARERIAVNAGWQERVEAQEQEHGRLTEQNKNLMQAVSQYQAAQKDTVRRTKELAQSLKDAIGRRDELQRQIKDIRGDLEGAIRHRDQLQTDIEAREARGEATVHALREKDNKIFKLSRELTSWQNRVPPLVDKFRQRDQEARALRSELERAEQRIADLEKQPPEEHTRMEPADPHALTEGLAASNDQYDETPEVDSREVDSREVDSRDVDLSDLQDQIADRDDYHSPQPIRTVDDSALYARFASDSGANEAPVNNRLEPNDAHDDLQQIKGVGPAIERTLHDLGIFSFDQIARISEYDINRIAERLKGFRSRIYREDWIGQARTLHDLRQTDPA